MKRKELPQSKKNITVDLRHEKLDINNYTCLQARGWVIESLNRIESRLASIITKYFRPQNDYHFKTIMLNPSVIGIGAKNKIVRSLDIIDKKTFDNIIALISIRNGFAHMEFTTNVTVYVDKESIRPNEVHQLLSIMNSNGKLKSETVNESLKKFKQIYDDVIIILRDIEKS